MSNIELNGEVIHSLKYINKHLFDSAVDKTTVTPKVGPSGAEIKSIQELSAVMGIDIDIAAVYIKQDTTTSPLLASQAHEVLHPSFYVAADDAYLPSVYQAYDLVSKDLSVDKLEVKIIKMVRTVSGVRRYGQDKGSIIIKDGQAPLTDLRALTNDIRGYEKLSDLQGNVYYIGIENGQWVARNPLDNSKLFSNNDESEVLYWLNDHASSKGKSKKVPEERATGEDIVNATPATSEPDDK